MRRKFLYLFLILTFSSCYSLQRSSGGGQRVDIEKSRTINTADIALPADYQIEVVAMGLTFPSGVAFDDAGTPYVTEAGYSYGEVFTEPKLLKIKEGGTTEIIAMGGTNGPWNGLWYHQGYFYVAEGGQIEGGKILQIDEKGNITTLLEGLPSLGDHHTNGPVVHDGYLYFGQGTATNASVTGKDNFKFGWLKRNPQFHDIPCDDIKLTGINYKTENFLNESEEMVSTGAYMPFGTASQPGQVIEGKVPCSGSVMRIPLQGGEPELVAWGFRNPFGLAFTTEGQLYVTDNSYDDRGSRPVWGAGDYLWKVEQGRWYGWPDYSGGQQIDNEYFKVPGGDEPQRILAEHPNEPPRPAALFGVHSSSNGFDFSRSPRFGFTGQAFVAQFGDMAPGVGKVLEPVGFKVVRVDMQTGVVSDFVTNKKKDAPASKLNNGGIERPVAVRFAPGGDELYIIDFGIMRITEEGPMPIEKTGVIWKVSKREQ